MQQLSYSRFPLITEVGKNDSERVGTLMLEYFDVVITIGTLEGTVELATALAEVLGVISLNYIAAASDPTDSYSLITDGVITTGAVTINMKAIDIADGDVHVRGFLVGKNRSQTVVL
jgi:hypothetical protein